MEAINYSMHRRLGKCIFFLLILNFYVQLFASHTDYNFEHLGVAEGISQTSIRCILQDHKGFLWLGTEGGLNRYDGYTLKTYSHEYDKKASLSNNNVKVLLEDSQKILWVGTENGLNRFDRLNETFDSYFKDPNNTNSLSHNHILSLYEDNQHMLWVGTNGGGLNRFDPKTSQWTHFSPRVCPGEKESTIVSTKCIISSIYQDSTGLFWLGTGCGLYSFDPKDSRFTRINLDAGTIGGNFLHIWVITGGTGGVLWLGTRGGGLIRFNPADHGFTYYQKEQTENPSGLNCDDVMSITQDPRNTNLLWVGTLGGGVNRFDLAQQRFVHYTKRAGIATSLSNDNVYSLYRDHSGILWIGTESGLNKLDERKNEFALWTVEPDQEEGLKNEYVWCIFKDSGGIIWIGTNEGLTRIDRNSGRISHYAVPDMEVDDKRVSAIHGDLEGNLWLGTRGSGVHRFNPRTEQFLPFSHDKNYPASFRNGFILDILVDRLGTVWVGTEKEGLIRFSPTTGVFTHFNWEIGNSTALCSQSVSCIYEDPTGVLWVGTTAGLNRLNPDQKTFTSYKYSSTRDDGLSYGHVSDIHTDSSGTLWVGTYGGGLNRLMNPVEGTFSHYRKKKEVKNSRSNQDDDQLPSDMINGILEDQMGYLWLSTDKGLSKFDPHDARCRNYDVRDGLQSNEFTGHACFKAAHDTEMLFGGINGFNTFYPERIIDNPFPPPLVITDFLVFNEPYLKYSVSEVETITLDYSQSVFSIEFAALDFAIPSKNKYMYKMEGVDPGWVTRDYTKRFAGYTELDPGTYSFYVKGSNGHGLWGPETVLKIKITPPFSKTWWFRILLFLFFLMLVLGAHLTRTRILRLKLAEQKRVQEILKESHEQMERARDLAELRHAENEKLLTAISALFIAVDSNHLIFQWNQSAVEFFSISRGNALHCQFEEVLKDLLKPQKIAEIIEKGLSQAQPFTEIEIPVDFSARGNGVKLLLANVSPILDRNGKKLGFLLMAEDITNRKEEEILLNLSKKLKALGQMASGIAHEIKTPLQYIGHNARFVGDSFNDVVRLFQVIREVLPELEQSNRGDWAVRIRQLMKEYDLDYILEEVPKAAEQIVNGVTKVSEIIHSMTEYSYHGRGFKEKWNINELLKSALAEVQHAIKKKADLQLDLADPLPTIPCYPGQLVQVFLSVLENAADAIEETGKMGLIRVSTTLENEQVVIAVADNGVGIPEANRENIFHPFFTTKEAGKGTGQGLSLARNVVTEKHNGKLEFISNVGEGTTFYIRLPLEKEGDM